MDENKNMNEEAFSEGWENEGFAEDAEEVQEGAEVTEDCEGTDADAAGDGGVETAEGRTAPVPMPVPVGGGFSDEARQRDFVAFAMEHPEVKNGDIPDEVWKRVIGGESLSSAWTRHENEGLKQRLQEMEQAELNRERSAGSRISSGSGERYDPFDEGWLEV